MSTKPTHILLIDDDPESRNLIVEEAKAHRLIVESFDNLEQGIEYLEAHQKIRAVILDSCGALDEEQNPQTIKTNFVFHAMDQINRIEHQQNRLIPFCVYSDNVFDLKNDLDGLARVFHKNKGPSPMFYHLKSMVAQLPEILVREKFVQIFDFIGDYMNDEEDDLMETLLVNAEKTDPATVINNLMFTRRLLEKLVDILCVNLMGKPPEHFIQKGKSRTRNILDAFGRSRQMPFALKNIAGDIYAFTSAFGNHAQTNSSDWYQPGKFAVHGQICLLLEIFAWASQKIESISK